MGQSACFRTRSSISYIAFTPASVKTVAPLFDSYEMKRPCSSLRDDRSGMFTPLPRSSEARVTMKFFCTCEAESRRGDTLERQGPPIPPDS